jgi:hypothetical protein
LIHNKHNNNNIIISYLIHHTYLLYTLSSTTYQSNCLIIGPCHSKPVLMSYSPTSSYYNGKIFESTNTGRANCVELGNNNDSGSSTTCPICQYKCRTVGGLKQHVQLYCKKRRLADVSKSRIVRRKTSAVVQSNQPITNESPDDDDGFAEFDPTKENNNNNNRSVELANLHTSSGRSATSATSGGQFYYGNFPQQQPPTIATVFDPRSGCCPTCGTSATLLNPRSTTTTTTTGFTNRPHYPINEPIYYPRQYHPEYQQQQQQQQQPIGTKHWL